MANQQSDTFYVGICMAGAVSAGAYTAGVMDYLIEALEEWERRRSDPGGRTPLHRVVIPVIGGASAGGMTSLITAAALQESFRPEADWRGPDQLRERPANRLFHSWVDLTSDDMFPLMLADDDITKEGVVSLLNAQFIDQIAARALELPAGAKPPERPYIYKGLKVFTTLTNLKGFIYDVGFATGGSNSKYYMSVHNDYACFRVGAEDKDDCWMPLDFGTGANVTVAQSAAMATGAFPVGLRARTVSRPSAYVNKIPWCMDVTQHFPVTGPAYTTLNIDGGVINNEPFEIVRDVLRETSGETQEAAGDFATFRSTVLMIDPFPSQEPGAFDMSPALTNVIGKTLGAMLGQLRSKPETLKDALDPKCPSQYLIAPTRAVPQLDGSGNVDRAGDLAIACGALGGFSGFLSKKFRVHDYFLGRANCEWFLRHYFTVSKEVIEQNPVFAGYRAAANWERFASGVTGGFPIIPIFTPQEKDVPLPDFGGSTWPVMSEEEVERFRPYLKKRAHAILMKSIEGLSWVTRLLVKAGAWIVLDGLIAGKAMDAIKSDLKKNQLMGKLPPRKAAGDSGPKGTVRTVSPDLKPAH